MIRLAAVALVVAWGLLFPEAEAFAQGAPLVREIKVGVLYHDMPGLWSGFQLEHGVGINGELILSPQAPLFGGYLRPAIGGTYAIPTGSLPATSKGYADVRWMYEAQNGLFASLGIGAAVHNGIIGGNADDDVNRKWLGHRILFHFPLELGWRFDKHQSISFYFDHISNGYTSRYNEGLDTLGVRYGYKF